MNIAVEDGLMLVGAKPSSWHTDDLGFQNEIQGLLLNYCMPMYIFPGHVVALPGNVKLSIKKKEEKTATKRKKCQQVRRSPCPVVVPLIKFALTECGVFGLGGKGRKEIQKLQLS